jgi:tRNA(Ile)-lysidine synthase
VSYPLHRVPCAEHRLPMYSPHQTVKKVQSTLSRHDMIRPGDLVVVAVSGGPDSVCLLHILHDLKDALQSKLLVAHFDHGLRPAEDDAETRFVRAMTEALGVPFETGKGRLLAKKASGSREEAARTARYAFFERVRKKYKAGRIALGHNLNDQAETIVMRLLRGSGPLGLTGIPPCRDGSIIRPLIEIDRLEIEAYLKAKKLAFATDSSNLGTDYLRNRIRLEVMPLLERHQPRLAPLLGQTAEILRDEHEYLERITGAWLEKEVSLGPGNACGVSLPSFLGLPVALRRRAGRRLIVRVKKDLRRITWDHIEAIRKLAESEKPQAVLSLPGRIQVRRTYDRLNFREKPKKERESFSYPLDGPGPYRIKEIGRTLSIEEMKSRKGLSLRRSKWTAFVDGEKLRFPLCLRTARPGDRFIPLGMKGHKKLKDFFVDLKVPLEQRRSTPILWCGDTPVWVCGFRIDDRFKVTPETKTVLKITLR